MAFPRSCVFNSLCGGKHAHVLAPGSRCSIVKGDLDLCTVELCQHFLNELSIVTAF